MNPLLLLERERLWDDHPLVCESAILPTRSVQDAVRRVLESSRKARSSIAWWAAPLTGKSTCLRAIENVVREKFPGCGCLYMEPVDDVGPTEGRLLEHILNSMSYASKVERALAAKRDQVHRALYALSGEAMRLFILIDEAQGLDLREYGWLKAIINRLVRAGVRIMCVLAGQQELKAQVSRLRSEGRSDLSKRFFSKLYQFHGCRTKEEFAAIADAIDTKTEYPVGSTWSYTQLLFPRAYEAGFRFAGVAEEVWSRLKNRCGAKVAQQGIRMEVIASVWAQLCVLHRKHDAADLKFTDDAIDKAIEASL